MGSGKTVVGKELARLLGFQFTDTDDLIEKSEGKKVAEIFEAQGEVFFREKEKAVLDFLAGEKKRVVSTGGGMWMTESNRLFLTRLGWCVWLRVSPEQSWRRVSKNLSQRPLLSRSPDPLGVLKALIQSRDPVYALAHFSVVTDLKKTNQISEDIAKAVEKARPFDLSFLQK